jgi:membrane-associated protease RseP (regulator of RpoE activity)
VVAAVPEASSGALSNATVAGFIGAGILKRFTVTWDYTGKRMVLLPNRTLSEPFETDASGLHLVSPGPQYQIVTIDSVLPGSPAAQAGLEPGDEILAVDEVSGLPLRKVSEALRKAGTSVVLTVQRKATILKITQPLSTDKLKRERWITTYGS